MRRNGYMVHGSRFLVFLLLRVFCYGFGILRVVFFWVRADVAIAYYSV
jgi:hypothetical protein